MHTGLKEEKKKDFCATYGHFMHAFCSDELCSGRVSIKLLPYYTFLENILLEGRTRNKHPPVSERKSSYSDGDNTD